MEELLHNNPDVQLQLIFTASNNEGDIKAPPVKHFLAIAEQYDEFVLREALDDWYLADVKDYAGFARKHPMNGELKKQDAKLTLMSEWCNKIDIEFTPTFFLSLPGDNDERNYFQLPKYYSVGDLKYLLSI